MTGTTVSSVDAGTGWHAPDPRMIVVHLGCLGAPLGSAALAALATGGRLDPSSVIALGSITVTFLVATSVRLVRWSRTRYRVTADSFELRDGLLSRRLRTVPLRRIRNVDLTATPAHRLLGLSVVRAGTVGSTGERSELRVDALTRAAAEQLRAELLRKAGREAVTGGLVASWDLRWVRYAPLTFWVFGGVLIVLGTAYRTLHEIGIEPWKIGVVQQVFKAFGVGTLWWMIPLTLAVMAFLGSIGAIALYVEQWWRLRLEWTDAQTLRVRRGLFTTRSVSMARAKIRGIRLREPLLLRAAGSATVQAVASGLGNIEDTRRRSGLLPPAPLAEARRVVSGVLGRSVFDRELAAHPRVALRRRVLRGLNLVVLPVTLALVVPGILVLPVLLVCAGIFLLLATPVLCWLAVDAYRNLGHAVDSDYLLVRSGTVSRDSVALQRSSIIAWTFDSSPFARRAGLRTLTAAVAGGEHGYRVPDLAADTAVILASTATPGILDEFMVHEEDVR